MRFQIIFENSGDFLPFTAINPELLCYILDQIEMTSDQLFYPLNESLGNQILQNLKNLQQGIQTTNKWYSYLTDELYPEFDDEFDLLDQNILNKLHAQWVNSQSQSKVYDISYRKEYPTPISKQIEDIYPDDVRFPTIASVISRLGLLEMYNDKVNHGVHNVERSFFNIQYKSKSIEWVEWENHYPHLVNDDICNLYLKFNHLGRTLSNKYEYFDFELEHLDENTFQKIIPDLGLNLRPPRTVPYSPEYVAWCKSKNRMPSGNLMPLGNLTNLFENIKKYRAIILKNLLSNNGFTIQKG